MAKKINSIIKPYLNNESRIIVDGNAVVINEWELSIKDKYFIDLTFTCTNTLEVGKVYDIFIVKGDKEFSQTFRIDKLKIDGKMISLYSYEASVCGKLTMRNTND